MTKPTRNAFGGFLGLSLLCMTSVLEAHNKVVVIPLGGNDGEVIILHPAATTFTNTIGMQFNELPAGSFIMGSPASEPGRLSNEVEHSVTLSKAFRIQIAEVTNAQWNDVIVDSLLGINPSTSHPGDNNFPVETVSWYDAVFFANRLSLDESRSICYTLSGVSGTPGSGSLSITSVTQIVNCTGYRLPTEAEWEYAARSGTTTAYANPISFDITEIESDMGFNGNLNAMGWYGYNREMENSSATTAYADGTKPVAQKQANAWGLYDMHGNVVEWNWDWYAAYVGDATDPVGPASGSLRVLRGGGWASSARDARSAFRLFTSSEFRSSGVGFRLVLPKDQ